MTNPSETLLKKSVSVVVGEDQYTIATFSFGKTLKLFSYVAALTAAARIKDAFEAAAELPTGEHALTSLPELENGDVLPELPTPGSSASTFISSLLDILPAALQGGTPVVYQLLGLLITSNKELKRLERDSEQDTDGVLRERGEDLAYDATNAEMLTLVGEALTVIGIESIIKAAGPLAAMLRR